MCANLSGIFVVCLLAALDGVGGAQTATVSETQLVRWLESPQQAIRQGAVGYLLDHPVPPEERSASLDRALAQELTRLNDLLEARWQADRAGIPPADDFPSDYHADLIQLVSQSTRDTSIPALLGALGTGRMASEGLVRFGEKAVPPLLVIARARVGLIATGGSTDTPPHIVSEALHTLEALLRSSAPLRASSKAEILQVVSGRLRTKQEVSVLSAACGLAVATGDAALRNRVQQLADDTREVVALGISDPQSIAFVQGVARRALSRQ